MAVNPVSLQLTWDISLVQSVDKSQRWVLSAMQADGPAVVKLLWRILGNETDVCDAYQDVFVRLIALPSEQKPRNNRAYLFRTAANVAISMLRREKLHRQTLPHLPQADNVPDPAGELDARWLQLRLRQAIARLPEYLSDVIALRDLGELSYGEVARTLGITEAAARVYRHKAVQLLAAWMDQSTQNRKQETESDL